MALSQWDAVVADVSKLTQQQIVSEAKRLHADVMRTPPRPVSFVRHVDGIEAPEEAVKLGGVIVYDYSRLDLVAKLALEILRELSPVGSKNDPHPGLYRDSHRVVKDTPTEVWITNTVAYSRVIEIAARGVIKLRIQKGGHVYEKAERRLRAIPEVGNSVRVKFTFTESAGPAASRSRADIKLAQWPTLILTAL